MPLTVRCCPAFGHREPPIATVPARTATGDEHATASVAAKTTVLRRIIHATLHVPPQGKPQRFARGVPPCRVDPAPVPRVRSGTVSGRSVRVSGGVIRSRVLWIVLVAVSVAAVVPPGGASAGGQRCGRAGAVRRIAGTPQVCTRVGGVLRWTARKSRSAKAVPPSPSELLAKNPPSPEPLSTCQLPDRRTTRSVGEWQAIAFPATPGAGFTNDGTNVAAVVFVDFPDAPGGANELRELRSEIAVAAEWYEWFSQGRVRYEMRFADRWVRAPLDSRNYYWKNPTKPGTQILPDEQIAATYRDLASSVLDVTGAAVVWAVIPRSVTAIDEGFAYRGQPSVFSTGSDTYRGGWPMWQTFVHETLHSHGALGHSPKHPRLGVFWHTGTDGPTLNSWDAVTLGWMRPEYLYCASVGTMTSATVALAPLEGRIEGTRAVMVRLSETEALVIESHRRSRWSERWPSDASGVSILRVDTRLDTVFGIGSSTARYLVPVGEYSLDFLVLGESYVADGIRITVVGSAAVDQVRVEPA